MNTLEDAWNWYQEAKRQVGLVRRLASAHWLELPWEGPLGRDDRFKGLDRKKLEEETQATLAQMDDLAVLVLFSVFESRVRERLAGELRREVSEKSVSHAVLLQAVDDLIQQVEDGSFFKVLAPYKSLDHNLVEEVNQVRRYRNWIAHGKRGKKPDAVDPRSAYERLDRFWRAIVPQSTGPEPDEAE
jgi:hypothetical protein